MNNKVDMATRIHFRDWLRQELRRLDFYQRRGDHYLIREFAKYCAEHKAPIDEASLGRYLRDEDPVLPTPERCRALGRVLEYEPVHVLIEAGYLEGDDLFKPLPVDITAADLALEIVRRQALTAQVTDVNQALDSLAAIVAQMKLSTDEMVESMATRRDTTAVRKELEKIATRKPGGQRPQGEAALAALTLDKIHEAEEQIRQDEQAKSRDEATAGRRGSK
jgi:hypothetical protein